MISLNKNTTFYKPYPHLIFENVFSDDDYQKLSDSFPKIDFLKKIQNKEVLSLLNAIGLRLGEDAEKLRYGKVLIYSDADPDGDSIAGLLTNFFGRYWPELLEKSMLYRVMTPLVVALKKKERKMSYTNEEFEEWKKSDDSRGWEISYK